MNDYLELHALYHHGIKGQKWGVRRYQNEDGTLTPEGMKKYGLGENDVKTYEDHVNSQIDYYDTGDNAREHRNAEIKKRHEKLNKLADQFNSHKKIRERGLEIKTVITKDKYGPAYTELMITDKKKNKTELFDDFYYDEADFIRSPDNADLKEVCEKLFNTEMEVSGLEEDPHFGRDLAISQMTTKLGRETVNKIMRFYGDMDVEEAKSKRNAEKRKRGAQVAMEILVSAAILLPMAIAASKSK